MAYGPPRAPGALKLIRAVRYVDWGGTDGRGIDGAEDIYWNICLAAGGSVVRYVLQCIRVKLGRHSASVRRIETARNKMANAGTRLVTREVPGVFGSYWCPEKVITNSGS